MIPLRLRLHNFLSFRDCTVDFAPLHLAVLCGANGHGKSALLDAITWALWGRSRAGTDDEAILTGENEMLVDLEFEVDRDRFAVNRKKTRGKTGQLQLFHVDTDGSRVPITGNVMRDTQADISRKLGLDHLTFRNSVFLAQGHADEFTRQPPARRKEVLRGVLGLERYEQYADYSRTLQRDAEAELGRLRARIGDGAEEVERLSPVRSRLDEIAAEEARLGAALAGGESAVASLRSAGAEFERRREAAERTAAAAVRLEREVDDAAEAAARAERELGALEGAIAGGDGIVERYCRLVALRAREAELAGRQAEGLALVEAIRGAEAAIATERSRLEAAGEAAAERLAECERAIADGAGLPDLRARLEGGQAEAAKLGAGAQEAVAGAQAARARAAGARATASSLKTRAQEIKDREAQLEGVARCPVCQSALAPGDLEHVRSEYAAQRRALGHEYRDTLAAGEEAEAEAERAEIEGARLAAERERVEAELRRLDLALHAREEAVNAARARRGEIAAEAQRFAGLLASGAFAVEARRACEAAQAKLATVDYDAGEHRDVRAAMVALHGVESEHQSYQAAVARAGAAREMASMAREQRTRAEGRLLLARDEASEARARLEAATDVAEPLATAERELAALRDQERTLWLERGNLERDRDRLVELAARLEAAREQEASLVEEAGLFGDLTRAFGKDGVQAMLIDQALPRMEIVANDLLDRMTGGRIRLQLSTRRETQSGGVRETLDIRIADELGQRDYELYSGGEAFRIDFALRIALSRLLAERSGAHLATLIIDEGFGTQDQEGLDRVVEALFAIKDEFRLILVVTHIEEMKQRFEHRIEVVKDAIRGSVATVS